MDFTLNKSQKEVQKSAWEFAKGEFDKEVIIELSKEQKIPDNIVKKSGELGFIGIHYPEAVDGGGMGLFEHVLVCETFCKKDSTLGAALMFSGYASECILRNAEKSLKEKYLPQIVDGKLTSTGAFLEPKQGYDLKKISTTAESDGDDWIINGKKTLVPSGNTAGIYVILCQTEARADTGAHLSTDGMSLILAKAGSNGISVDNIRQNLGNRMMPFTDITFTNVRVPKSNLIGKQGSGYAMTQNFFTENRIQIAALALGTAQGAFERALNYVKQREQFGKKLAQFQITRHKLADMASKIEAARYLTYHAAWCFDNKKTEPHQAAMAKITAARAAVEVSHEAIQLLGGYGYMTEYEVEHFFRDAKQAEIFQGPPAIQKDIIADSIIGKLK
ncbi:MAG: acyl-CoA/acyl-ACP dehydrogenase [Desulfobacteraceae bacterium]|jgi:alkylation response protein AidB-like acyl-CoA dehydrogenase|nr:acyl-CoA/acyl-ACP dehydrogenase [Desulfobacteraceae bacterium]